MLRALGVDMRRIGFDYGQPNTGPDADGYTRTMWGARHRKTDPGDGQPNWIAPFNDDTKVDEVHAHAWPEAGNLDYSKVRDQCRKHHPEYATFGAPWSPFFHEVGWLIGQENFMVWMHTKPEVVRAIIDHVVAYEVDASRRFFQAADGMLDIAYFGNDFGTDLSFHGGVDTQRTLPFGSVNDVRAEVQKLLNPRPVEIQIFSSRSIVDILNHLKTHSYQPDLVIFQGGENDTFDEAFRQCYRELIPFFKDGMRPKVVDAIVLGDWYSRDKAEFDRQAATQAEHPFVDLFSLQTIPENKGNGGPFKHAGVASHPNDAGMKAISDALLTVFKEHILPAHNQAVEATS